MSEAEILRWSSPVVALASIPFWRHALGRRAPSNEWNRRISRFTSGGFGATFLAASLAAYCQPPPVPRAVFFLVVATFGVTFVSLSLDVRRRARHSEPAAFYEGDAVKPSSSDNAGGD
jgi:hypothetical protein